MIEESPLKCEFCDESIASDDLFCPHCGKKQSNKEESVTIDEKPMRGVLKEPIDKKLRQAANWVLALSVMFVISGTFLGITTHNTNQEARETLEAYDDEEEWTVPINDKYYTVGELRELLTTEVTQVFVTNYVLAVIMLGIFFWARKNALPALITALCIYLAVQVLNAIISPMTLVQGWIIKILFIAAMVAGIKAALEVRKHKMEAQSFEA
ncbi:MAG: hypothetical protein JXR70_16760 [Spirochaetales bacterium]|nr:hypothetical protein [Spirochaetales bacterium]